MKIVNGVVVSLTKSSGAQLAPRAYQKKEIVDNWYAGQEVPSEWFVRKEPFDVKGPTLGIIDSQDRFSIQYWDNNLTRNVSEEFEALSNGLSVLGSSSSFGWESLSFNNTPTEEQQARFVDWASARGAVVQVLKFDENSDPIDTFKLFHVVRDGELQQTV